MLRANVSIASRVGLAFEPGMMMGSSRARARPATYTAGGGLGNVARDGMGFDGGLAGLNLALGSSSPGSNAIARTPAFGGLMMIEWAAAHPALTGRATNWRGPADGWHPEPVWIPNIIPWRAPSSRIRPRVVKPASKPARPLLAGS